jgi:hypothetical protein
MYDILGKIQSNKMTIDILVDLLKGHLSAKVSKHIRHIFMLTTYYVQTLYGNPTYNPFFVLVNAGLNLRLLHLQLFLVHSKLFKPCCVCLYFYVEDRVWGVSLLQGKCIKCEY